jgi:hypothetical protein
MKGMRMGKGDEAGVQEWSPLNAVAPADDDDAVGIGHIGVAGHPPLLGEDSLGIGGIVCPLELIALKSGEGPHIPSRDPVKDPNRLG